MFKMFSCKDISKVSCHKDDLSLSERLNYRLHMFICGTCREYTEGVEAISSRFSEIVKKRREVSSDKVTKLENRILDSIKKKNETE